VFLRGELERNVGDLVLKNWFNVQFSIAAVLQCLDRFGVIGLKGRNVTRHLI
jgi:hypothetical protein